MWLRERIVPVLREAGYKGSGQNFHRLCGSNWGVLNFQRSQWDWAERVTFTVNLGTASKAAHEILGDDPPLPPAEAMSHWQERLGPLLVGRDLWWEIRAEPNADANDLDAIALEVIDALTRVAFPAIEAHSSDEVILENALEGRSMGYRQLDVAGALLGTVGGTPDQHAQFRALVDESRHFMLARDSFDPRPAQGPKRVAANLVQLHDLRSSRRADAAHLLGRAIPTSEVISALRQAARDTDALVRSRAAASLAELGDLPSLEQMLDVLEAERNRFRAVDLGWALCDLASRTPEIRPRIILALRGRYDCAVGLDLAGFGATLERLDDARPEDPWFRGPSPYL